MKRISILLASLAFAASASAGGFSDYDSMLSASPHGAGAGDRTVMGCEHGHSEHRAPSAWSSTDSRI